MPGPFYFSYLDAPIAFDQDAHARWDEAIISATVAQEEGDFASLEIDVLNPGAGLLSPGRLPWCWFAWDNGSEIVPLFCGRIVGVPEQLDGEAVRLLFRARPDDFAEQKFDTADTLKVLPYYDPVWITGDLSDLDQVLNAYGAHWHIDRTTLALTISDDLEGEDGTLEIGEGDHTYDNTELSYADKPKRKVKFKGTLSWTQTGKGTIDLTQNIYRLFRSQKSIYVGPNGVISTLTGEGLKGDWPKAGTSIGGGWTVNDDTSCQDADDRIYAPYTYDVTYQGLAPDWESSTTSTAKYFLDAFTEYTIKFPVAALKQKTLFDYAASKARTEILEFTMFADLPPIDTGEDDDETTLSVTMSASDTVTEPDDDDVMPIGDKRRAAYLTTDRGASSVQYAMRVCYAELRRAARSCEAKCRVPWVIGIDATLRKSMRLIDRRLSGGEAIGKITAYTMTASAADGFYVDITAGCAIGRGGTVSASAGDGVYSDGSYGDGYEVTTGETIAVPGAETALVYETLDDFTIDDDGVSLLTLDATTAVQSLTLTGGLADQVTAVTDALDPLAAIKDYPSVVTLQLAPVADVSFETTFSPTIATVPIPRGIDLEAA